VPVSCHAIPATAIAGPGMRSWQRVMVSVLSWMVLHRALVDSFPLELSSELSQSDANEHIPLDAR
jgi:hypothetical protein